MGQAVVNDQALKERLDHFRSLPEGWDSYGAEQIREESIDDAFKLVDRWPDFFTFAAPIPNGWCQLEMQRGERYFEAECQGGGLYNVLAGDEAADDLTIDELAPLLEELR